MLVVTHTEPFSQVREKIIISRHVLNGLLTALHIRLDHPTPFQLKLVVTRYFYALDLDHALQQTSKGCHTCVSLSRLPKSTAPPTTSDPPESIGLNFAADIIRIYKQKILVAREIVTSLTSACLIERENHSDIRDGLISLCVGLRPLDRPSAVIRVDPAPGFVKLKEDKTLLKHHLCIEVGRITNINKNAVAEKAIKELEDELIRQNPDGNQITTIMLAISTHEYVYRNYLPKSYGRKEINLHINKSLCMTETLYKISINTN